ncbi:MAG: LuxR C-terminal-related transcriptional regulator [Micrococcales bacterium]|nr:LuxR C-terminal-related transcriptional regulator [Micrococcales bacterium]
MSQYTDDDVAAGRWQTVATTDERFGSRRGQVGIGNDIEKVLPWSSGLWSAAYGDAVDREQAEVVDDIVGYLSDAISVNLVGLRGSGRSQVARLVADRLRESGCAVVTISGIATLRDRPLAVLALAGVEVPPGAAASAISGAVTALARQMAPRRSVLVIDDADDLDPVTSGAVVAAYARQRFAVLSVTRLPGRRQPAGRSLTAEFQPGVRVALEPLTFDQLHRIIHQMLSGLVDSATIARIATLSGGLPGLVGAIVDTGRRTGAITEDRGLWQAKGELWHNRLAQAVDPLLVDLADEDLEALTKLSFAGTIAVADAQQLVPAPAFARLDEQGLLQVVATSAGSLVGVFPPLVAEYLRRTGGTTTQLFALDVPGRHSSGSLVTPRLSLTSSHAAILNVRIVEYWRAEVDALRAAWRADPGVENAVSLLDALNASSAEPEEIASVLADTRLVDADPMWYARFISWTAVHQALVLDDLDGARKVLARQRKAHPQFAAQQRAIEASLELLAGKMPDVKLLKSDDPEDDPLGAEGVAAMRVAALAAQGRTADALAVSPDVTPQHPYYIENYRVGVGLARVLHGDFDAGIEWALRAMTEAENALDLGEIHAHAYVAALGMAFAGRLDDLDALFGPVLTLSGTTMLTDQYRIGVLNLAALAAGWRGRMDYGWSLSVQAQTTGHRQGPFPAMLHGVTPAMADPQDDWKAAGERLWQAVQERFDKGFVAAGIAAAITAVEVAPDVARAATVVEQAHSTQSPFLVALGDYIAATAGRDPETLAECAADLWARGARVHSVKASVTRALALRERGEIEASIRQAEKAWTRASEFFPGCRGLFYRLGVAVGLNAREREIARMLANGMTGPSIAASLGLSARTVENYLFSAYRKLGSEGRDDLVRAVSTWAALD